MTKPLSKIISDGTLVDNRAYQANNGLFSIGRSSSPISIYQGRGRNCPGSVWPLLKRASQEINMALRSRLGSKVFLFPDRDYEHNTADDFIQLQGSGPLNFTLATGNLIGCVKHGDYTLRISSRFGDEFLKYIIADTDGFVELPEHGGEDKGSYDWLLVYLWLIKLKQAFRLGLPKTYESRTENTPQVRGRLDSVDYFLNHERAQYRCIYREHSYDNDVTRLIAHTLEILDSHAFLRESHTLNQTFQIATQGRRTPLRDLLTTKPIRNPYYSDYNPVIALSKQILRNEYADFGDQSQTSAFFFDVSMLFEYFIRKLLKRSGASFHSKTNHLLEIPTGLLTGYTRRKLIPDLVFDLDGQTYVFDVKYKSFDFRYGVNREDLFQLHTYIGQFSNQSIVAGCGFIYPIRESRWHTQELESTAGIFSDTFAQGNRTIPFRVVFLKVPEQGETPSDVWPSYFRSAFKSSCNTFTHKLLCAINHTYAAAAHPIR
jgi:5-methylcytosine-specific restriction enzyme subunit McrC